MPRQPPHLAMDDPRYIKALSHPLRVRILAMLQERAASPNQLSGWLGATLGTTAYHVRNLHDLGLIELTNETRVRGAIEHHYRARPRPAITGEAWAAAPAVAKQATVSSALQTVSEVAAKSAAAGGFDRPDTHLSRAALKLDAKGWHQLEKATGRFLEQLAKIEEGVQTRQPEQTVTAAVVLMAFEASLLADG